jgi:broad specificity phosphatase PhoE
MLAEREKVPMKLLLIRHGQSIANAEGRWQGQMNSPLSELGRAQAQALARRLGDEGWDLAALYASDLSRAAETAEILASELAMPVHLDPRLREYDVGVLHGLVWDEIQAQYPEIWHGLQHSDEWLPIPGEEGGEAFRQRLAAALAEIQAQHGDDEAVALVSHGGSLGQILAQLLGLDLHRRTPFRFGNTSLSIVEWHAHRVLLQCHNDLCHLRDNHGGSE